MAFMQSFAPIEEGKAPQESITVISFVGSTVARDIFSSLAKKQVFALVPFTLLICTYVTEKSMEVYIRAER